MDNTETHYVTFDPDAIYREMLETYLENGGDVIYPGDEKEMLLRGAEAILIQALATVDNGLRMATLEYATGEYLDLYGETRSCPRIQDAKAKAVMKVRFRATLVTNTIPAGTQVLPENGTEIYVTDSDIIHTGGFETYQVGITAKNAGSAGNALEENTKMQFLTDVPGLQESPRIVTAATGGADRETDADYRERIRNHPLTNQPTGGKAYYEEAALRASHEIIDAAVIPGVGGVVSVKLLLAQGADADTVIASVEEAVNAIRLVNDIPEVEEAIAKDYVLNVLYTAEPGSETADKIANAVADYKYWQESRIGRAFNPNRLIAMLYQAGCTQAYFGSGSYFGQPGGAVQYTEIAGKEYCKGTITVGVAP